MNNNVKFNLIFESYAKDDFRKKLRSVDEHYDIGKRRKDERFWVYSSEAIDSLALDHKSKHANEPRPFVYFVDENELQKVFPKAKLELLDAKSYTKEERDKYLSK